MTESVKFKDSDKYECAKKCCKQFWPKNVTAASILLVVSTYTTLLAIVDQVSTKEALKDADDQAIFNINEEITNVTVSAITKSILWNCRDFSVTKNYYKGFYIALLTILFGYVIIGMSKLCRCCCCDDCCEFCEKRCEECHDIENCEYEESTCMTFLQILSDIFLRGSLIFLLTSYDIDPWICFSGPSDVIYMEDTHEVDLLFPKDALRYQKAGPILSAFFGIVGWILGCFALEEEEEEED